MPTPGQCAPAFLRRAFFVSLAIAGPLFGAAPPSAPPGLAQTGKPDPAEVRRILDQFRHTGIAGDYYLEFELHQLPRQGDERVFPGQVWGGHTAAGTIVRIALKDAAGKESRLLMQNGDAPAVWRWSEGHATQTDISALLEPLVPGVELSAFDLTMPFTAWPDAECTAIVRMLGRPAYAFFLRPPPAFASHHPQPAAVRAYFDAQFNAPTQTEWLDATGRVTRTLSLVELKRVSGQTIPKVLEVRNETTRDKTRFVVTAAALGLELGGEVFAPGALGSPLNRPAAARIVKLAR